eukprot:3811124-Amphidinium_carterae.1
MKRSRSPLSEQRVALCCVVWNGEDEQHKRFLLARQKGAGGYWLATTRDADKYRDVHLGQAHVEQRRFANWDTAKPAVA